MALSEDEKKALDCMGYIPMRPATEEHRTYLMSEEYSRRSAKIFGKTKSITFDINEQVTPVVLEYLEPGWHDQTVQCLINAGFKQENILQVGREGVGSMSAAFNRVFEGVYGFDLITTPYVWFLTNVTFEKECILQLVDTIEAKGLKQCAVLHPQFNSDHPFIAKPQVIDSVPFVELTAPLFRMEALRDVGLMDELMPYWGMDADWGYRAKKKGWWCFVEGYTSIQHTYLHQSQPYPISKIRAALRSLYDEQTRNRLIEKYGTDWKQKICPNGGC